MANLKDITIIIHARVAEDEDVVEYKDGQYTINNDAMTIASVVTREGWQNQRADDCHYGPGPH